LALRFGFQTITDFGSRGTPLQMRVVNNFFAKKNREKFCQFRKWL